MGTVDFDGTLAIGNKARSKTHWASLQAGVQARDGQRDMRLEARARFGGRGGSGLRAAGY